jgi:hypothetical protein
MSMLNTLCQRYLPLFSKPLLIVLVLVLVLGLGFGFAGLMVVVTGL